MKTTFLLLSLLALHPVVAADKPLLKLTAEVKGFASPEGIAWDGTYYYVSNVGKELKPTDKDGDGFISRMDAKGENLTLDFITKLNAPKGMVVVGKTLYVCDVDLLLGYDLASKEKTFEVSFAKDGVRFINDICAAGEGKLLVSATDKNQVYLVDIEKKSTAAIKFDGTIKGPNGLVYIEAEGTSYMMLAEWGADNKPNGSIKVYELDDTMREATREDNPENFPVKDGFLDGAALVMSDDDEPLGFLYTDWLAFNPGGKLFYVQSEMGEPVLFDLDLPKGPVAGPADFFYDGKSGALVLPCMMEGRVLIMKLELPKVEEKVGVGRD